MFRLLFVILSLLLLIIILFDLGIYKNKLVLDLKNIKKIDGRAYSLPVDIVVPYSSVLYLKVQNENSAKSNIEIEYNHIRLEKPNKSYNEIKIVGDGSYSLWNGDLTFSTPGNVPLDLSKDQIELYYYPIFSFHFKITVICIFIIHLILLYFVDSLNFLKKLYSNPASHNCIRVFSLMILLILFFLTYIDSFYGVWNHDSGYYLKRMWVLNKGVSLYSDISFMYPSLLIHMGAIFFKLQVHPLLISVLIPLSLKVANLLLTGSIAFINTRSVFFSFLVSGLYLIFNIENQGTHMTLEHGVVLFSLLFFCFIPFSKEDWKFKDSYFLLFGVLIGLAAISKQIGITYMLPAVILALQVNFKTIFKRITFLFLGIVLAVIFFLYLENFQFLSIKSQLVDFFKSNMQIHNKYDWRFIMNEFSRSILSVIITFIAVIGLIISSSRKENRTNINYFYFSLLFVFLILTLTRFVRNFPHYSLNCWPIILVGWMSLYKICLARQAKYIIHMLLLVPFGFLSQEVMNRQTLKSRWQTESVLLDLMWPAADYLKSELKINDKFLQVGEEEILEVLSNREPISYKMIWDDSYDSIAFTSNWVSLYNYGQNGVDNFLVKLKNEGYKVRFEKSLYGHPDLLPKVMIFKKQE